LPVDRIDNADRIRDEDRVDSILELAASLIRVPSQTGIDSSQPVAEAITDWLWGRGLRPRPVEESRPELGVVCMIGEDRGGPVWVLDAPIDTAPVGDSSRWACDPFGGDIVDGWLCGRGSGDCKTAVALFAHLAADLAEGGGSRIAVLFDGDEHSGSFGGARAFFDQLRHQGIDVGGVMIGYPGNDRVITGSRGFLRAIVRLRGPSGHSGGSHPPPTTAIQAAARLVEDLGRAAPIPATEPAPSFPLPPRLTVTAIKGGGGFTTIADLCELSVDIRLTPEFEGHDAEVHLRSVVGQIPLGIDAEIEMIGAWPSYQLGPGSRVATALCRAAADTYGHTIPTAVSGPSNLGNYLASKSIEATAGFGVAARNIHGTDEAIDCSTIGPVYATYRQAVEELRRPG
jgi:succinyl-diaminopimelate desuccinylase